MFFCGIVSVEWLMQGQAVPAPPLPSPDRRLLRRGKGAPVAHHGAAATMYQNWHAGLGATICAGPAGAFRFTMGLQNWPLAVFHP